MIFRTYSESLYEVDGLRIRRIERSPLSSAERVSGEWRTAESISTPQIGHPVQIFWGYGTDEHSPDGIPDGQMNARLTITSPVREILEP